MNRRSSVFFAVTLSLTLSLASLLFCSKGDSQGQPDPADKPVAAAEPRLPDTLVVAAYNVENLFDFVLDGTEYDEYKPGWFGWTEEVQKTKLANTAKVVAALQADIIGLNEVENLNVLRELQNELKKMDAVYPYGVVGETPRSAVLNALLSKYPIVRKFEHPVEKSRSILEAQIARGGDTVILFVNHWPSKRHPESTRLAAAEILRARLDGLPPNADYIIIGDLNSNYNEFATFHTTGHNDTRGRTGINHVLKTVIPPNTPRSPARFVCRREMAVCTDCHYNLWLDLPEDGRMNYIYRGQANTLDHILVPAAMFDTVGYSYLVGSFEVFTMDGTLLRDGVPYRWQMVFRGQQRYHSGRGYSDHLPIRARFVRAPIAVAAAAEAEIAGYCDSGISPDLTVGDFAVTVDGWVSGDSRFSVARDNRYKRTGTHSLRVSGLHETENRTAARALLEMNDGRKKYLRMSVRGSGNLSIRIRRPTYKWVNFNAPDFKPAKSIRYKPWSSNSWVDLRVPIPESADPRADVEVELRAGKGERFTVWVDRVRLE